MRRSGRVRGRIGRSVLAVLAVTAATVVAQAERAGAVPGISVDPVTELHDGDTVQVEVTGWETGEIVIAQCEYVVNPAATNCDPATLLTSPAANPLLVSMTVRSTLHLFDGRTLDCHAVGVQCVIAAAKLGENPLQPVSMLTEFALPAQGRVEGTVTGPGGGAVAGAEVSKAPCEEGPVCQTTFTDSLGHYAFPRLRAGDEVEIWVTPPEHTFLLSEPPNVEGGAAPEPFALADGETVVHDVVLGTGGRVEVNPTLRGAPVSFAEATLCDAQLDCWSGFDGEFRGALPPGAYRLDLTDFVEVDLPPQGPFDVEVVAGETTAVAPAVDAVHFMGRVRTTDGDGVPNAAFIIRCAGCGIYATESRADGSFDIWLPPSTYAVTMAPPQPYGPLQMFEASGVAGDDIVHDFVVDKHPILRVRVPGAAIMGVDACEVGGPHCATGKVGAGASLDVSELHEGSRYDLLVDGLIKGELRSVVITDVEINEGLNTVIAWTSPDVDADGASNAYESGDRDGNGVADRDEGRVVSARSFDLAPFSFSRAGFIPTRDLTFQWMVGARVGEWSPPPPTGVDFPHGVMTVRMNSVVSETTVEVVLPEVSDALYLRSGDEWVLAGGTEFPEASVVGRSAALPVSDGGAFDLDGVVNGVVQLDLASGSVRPAPFDQALIVDGPVGFVDGTDADFVVSAPVGAELLCSLDLTPFEVCDATPSYAGLEPGFHVLVVQPITGGDPGSAARADLRLWYAGAPPGLRAVGGPSGVTSETSATFTMVGPGGEGGEGALCLFDFVEVFVCGSEITRSGLRDGAHLLVVFDPDSPVGLSDLRVWFVRS